MELNFPRIIRYKGKFVKGNIPPFANRSMIYTSEQKRLNAINALKTGRQKGIQKPKQNKKTIVIDKNGNPIFFDSIKNSRMDWRKCFLH